MLVDRTFDNTRSVVDIPFCGKDHIISLFNDYPDMIVLPVFKDSIVKNDITSFRYKAFCAFMIFNARIAYRKFFPGDASGQTTGAAFVRTIRDLKARFPAAIIHESSTPISVGFFKSPTGKDLNYRLKICFFSSVDPWKGSCAIAVATFTKCFLVPFFIIVFSNSDLSLYSSFDNSHHPASSYSG